MELRLLSLSFFLYLALVGSHAFDQKVDWEEYWHSVLPNTPFPKVLSNVLQPAYTQIQGKNINEAIGNNAIAYGTQSGNLPEQLYTWTSYTSTPYSDASPQDTNIGNGRDHETIFFLENNLQPAGQILKLRFPENGKNAKFLPRKVANTIPFSGKKLPEILNGFDIKPGSFQAEVVKETIRECEEQAMQGEKKFCATSPESLIDFGISVLGKKVEVFTTDVEDDDQKMSNKLQEYSVENVGKALQKVGDSSVVCHKQNYVYAVFYCHEISATRAYTVSLVGADGTRAKAVALCHHDTRFWNPQHVAFQILKVKPGTVPICHFLSRDSLVWVPN